MVELDPRDNYGKHCSNVTSMVQQSFKGKPKTNLKNFPCQLFIADLYHQNKLLDWQSFKEKLNLTQKDYFGWRQIIAAIPKSWKN